MESMKPRKVSRKERTDAARERRKEYLTVVLISIPSAFVGSCIAFFIEYLIKHLFL